MENYASCLTFGLKSYRMAFKASNILLILIIVVVTVFILIQSMDPQTTANIDNNTVNPKMQLKKQGRLANVKLPINSAG